MKTALWLVGLGFWGSSISFSQDATGVINPNGTITIYDNPSRDNDRPKRGIFHFDFSEETRLKKEKLRLENEQLKQQQAFQEASQKRLAEKAKIDAELLGHIRKQSADVFELFDALKGLQPWDAESLKD